MIIIAILKAFWREILSPVIFGCIELLISIFRLIWGLLRTLRFMFVDHQKIKIGEHTISVPKAYVEEFEEILFGALTYAKLNNFSIIYSTIENVVPQVVRILVLTDDNGISLQLRSFFFSKKLDAIWIREGNSSVSNKINVGIRAKRYSRRGRLNFLKSFAEAVYNLK